MKKARVGILIKNVGDIESAAKINAFVFDNHDSRRNHGCTSLLEFAAGNDMVKRVPCWPWKRVCFTRRIC